MACLLQPECNFLHGFLRCKLPVEVDVEVKLTSMQGTHIFRRDRMTQLIKCTPWSMRLHPHPTIIKKMRTFLEVENKMEPIIPAPANQFRPQLPETNPSIRKNDTTEKRKRAAPKKKFRPATPKITAMHPPLLEAPPKPKSSAPSAPVREDTPWPGAGKMSGNLFMDRNWLLPKNYLVTEKKEDTNVASARPPLKEEPKAEEQATNPKAAKCSWGPDCPFCKSQKKEEESKQQQKLSPGIPRPQTKRPDTLSPSKTKQQWEAEMERWNSKYNLDCFSDSELDSESNKEEKYQYEHGYKTLI